MAYWQDISLLARMQTDFSTPCTHADAATFQSLKAANVKLDLAPEIESLDVLTGQAGAEPERIVGARKWKLTFDMPLEGLQTGFAAATDVLGTDADLVPPWFPMFASALGGIAAPTNNAGFWKGETTKRVLATKYVAAGVLSSTSSVITAEAGKWASGAGNADAHAGCFIATAKTPWTTVQCGFGTTIAGDALTLRHAARNDNNHTDYNICPTLTAWTGSNGIAPDALTFYLTGSSARANYILKSGVPSKVSIKLATGKTPIITFEYQGYDFAVNAHVGGLVAPPLPLVAADTFTRIPQLSANLSARLIGPDGAGTAVGSTAAGICGLEDVEMSWTPEYREIQCHGSGMGGVSEIVYVKPVVEIKAWIPWRSTDGIYTSAGVETGGADTDGQHVWESYLELGTKWGFGVESASIIGKVVSFFAPQVLVYDVPKFEEKSGLWGYNTTFRTGSVTGDVAFDGETTADSPINSTFRVGMA